MKLKEISRTSTIAWSPIQSCQAIVTGTVAGALDENFSNTTELEIFKLDWATKQTDLNEPAAVVTSNARFNRLTWSLPQSDYNLGIIAGGMENGEIDFWNPEKILAGEGSEASLISRQNKHSGAVKGLEFNPFQANLLASGGGNGEVFIWNLGDLTKPYNPGPKSSKLGDVTDLSWNKKVPHILATSSNSGYTVIWDLKNRREVMSLGYQQSGNSNFSHGGVTSVAWNPDSATQLVTASEDDNNPVIMLWDLRNANAPEKVFSGHNKGVLSLAWCPMDSDLLLSCGKDNRNICWNPKNGEILGELPQSNNWAFDIQWSPRNPNILSSSSFDGKVTIHSILSSDEEKVKTEVENSEDFFNSNVSANTTTSTLKLKQPPKWFRRPVGASFGFGGQLTRFNNTKGSIISVTNIVSEPVIKERAEELKQVLEQENIDEFINKRIEQSPDDKLSWDVIKLLFEQDSRKQLVDMLISNKDLSIEKLNEELANFNLDKGSEGADEPKEEIKETTEETAQPDELENTEATQQANQESNNHLFGDNGDHEDDFFNKTHQTQEQPIVGQTEDKKNEIISDPFSIIGSNSDLQSLLSKLIIVGDYKSAVKACLNNQQYADALLIAMVSGNELLEKTKNEIFKLRRNEASYVRLLEGVVNGSLEDVVHNADLEEWEKILTMLCTYAQGEEFGLLTEKLGIRLANSPDKSEHKKNALLCFLLSGNIEKVVTIWVSDYLSKQNNVYPNSQLNGEQPSPSNQMFYDSNILQELVEKVSLYIKAVNFASAENEQEIEKNKKLNTLYSLYYEYAQFLVSQGLLDIAAKYLNMIPLSYRKETNEDSLDEYSALKYRLYYSGVDISSFDPSSFPFNYIEIGGSTGTNNSNVAQQQYTQPKATSYSNTASQYPPTAQEPYYGGGYQLYSNAGLDQSSTNQLYNITPLDQTSTNQLYNPTGLGQTSANSLYNTNTTANNSDISSLYNPYPNYPPTNTNTLNNNAYPNYDNNSINEIQESVTPPSVQRGGPGWNDPPTEVFANKHKSNANKASALTNPFANSPSPMNSMPVPNHQNTSAPPAYGGVNKNLPPPPKGGKAPTPFYQHKEQNVNPNVNQNIGFQPPLPPQHHQSQQPPSHLPPQQHNQQQQPISHMPPPPQQKPLYQTNPVKPTHSAPPSQPAQRVPSGQPGQVPGHAPGHAPGRNPQQPFHQQQQSRQQPFQQQQQQQSSAVLSPPQAKQNVSLDRSKMPPKYKELYEMLNKHIVTFKSLALFSIN
ncbi:WD40 repeat-like protein [Neoconidiobolus thromboides FSU 785]|nr:WD40 repeat-like protein [Neoconidiobolus thromboides FSU 785]